MAFLRLVVDGRASLHDVGQPRGVEGLAVTEADLDHVPAARQTGEANFLLDQLRAGSRLRFGVVHRYSSHNYMLRYWLAACGIRPDTDVEIVTVAPPFCADALQAGDVDGICVGEPWNSVAVARGAGRIVLATAQIWRRGVEKVLALRELASPATICLLEPIDTVTVTVDGGQAVFA